MRRRDSSFSIIIVFVCLSIIGMALTPLLNIQLNSSASTKTLFISFNWKNASSKIIEQEVTSKIEGLINKVKEVKEVSSFSDKGHGIIMVKLKKNASADAVRFEISNLLSHIYNELPDGVSYPKLSLRGGSNTQPILSYSINANAPPYNIKKYTEDHLLSKLRKVKGINNINVYGTTSYEWVIKYDPQKIFLLNISIDQIKESIERYFKDEEIGQGFIISNIDKIKLNVSLTTKYKPDDKINWNNIPIKKTENGKIIFLKDIAIVQFKEATAVSHYRINGQNSINLVIYPEKGVNTIKIAKEVKSIVNEIVNEKFTINLTLDTTRFLSQELSKIQTRMLFSIIFLLLLILLINRNLKYITILTISIITNLLIAFIFYYIFDIELQIYSLAGITISLGIIIDNSIVMINHYNNKQNKKVFLAILAATLTTIGALLIIHLLNDTQQEKLLDFSLVIIFNLGVSLFVSLYLIPSLLNKFKLKQKNSSRNSKRRIIKFNQRYYSLITTIQKPYIKFFFISSLIFSFGIPIEFLPEKIKKENILSKIYNSTIGNDYVYHKIKPKAEKLLGGSLRLFTQNVYNKSYDSEPEQTTLKIEAKIPDNCNLKQLNGIVHKLESYLKTFNEIELFETITSPHKKSITSIYFKKESEHTKFPLELKELIENRTTKLGGVNWYIEGIGPGFSSAIESSKKFNRITLEGYQYEKLYSLADSLKKKLLRSSSRVKNIEIVSGIGREKPPLHEYYLEFDNERLGYNNIPQTKLHNFLKRKIYLGHVTSIIKDNEFQEVKLISNQYSKNNLWTIKNSPILIHENQYKLNQFAKLKKKKTGNTIFKKNQQYNLTLTYDFLGTLSLAQKLKEDNINEIQHKLPIGYRIFDESKFGWDKNDNDSYYFLLLIPIIIFFICSVLLESLFQSFIIVCMIPISFIGVFLIFYLFSFNFDQGGYASFVLLSGISVNSALYILNDYNNLKKINPKKNLYSLYLKAYNYKITPVILTIISTIIGLIPFIWDGQNEVFWFSFAIGSIGGLLFSLFSIILCLPVFLLKKVNLI